MRGILFRLTLLAAVGFRLQSKQRSHAGARSIAPALWHGKHRYDFKAGARRHGQLSDGASPESAVLNAGGTLYGTTPVQYPNECCGLAATYPYGALIAVGNSLFGTALDGGDDPNAGLVALNGKLYGTTTHGGGCGLFSGGCGTVFSIDPADGDESVVYAFKGGDDARRPSSTLIDISGTLYGTTATGGGCSSGCGTIFSVTP